MLCYRGTTLSIFNADEEVFSRCKSLIIEIFWETLIIM
jgi:hypothetical protein